MEVANLSDVYLQMKLNEESKKLVIMNAHRGLYRYRCLPFGLNCAPTIFQKIISQTLADIPRVSSYMDGHKKEHKHV